MMAQSLWSPFATVTAASPSCSLNCGGGGGVSVCPKIGRRRFSVWGLFSIDRSELGLEGDPRLNEGFVSKGFSDTPWPSLGQKDVKESAECKAAPEAHQAEARNLEIENALGKSTRGALQKSLAMWQDSENFAEGRLLTRYRHHLLAIASLFNVSRTDKQVICHEQGQISHPRRERAKFRVDDDDNGGQVKFGNRSSGVFHLQQIAMHLWNGYWIGPDDDDGWGFVEAFVSPAGMDQLFV